MKYRFFINIRLDIIIRRFMVLLVVALTFFIIFKGCQMVKDKDNYDEIGFIEKIIDNNSLKMAENMLENFSYSGVPKGFLNLNNENFVGEMILSQMNFLGDKRAELRAMMGDKGYREGSFFYKKEEKKEEIPQDNIEEPGKEPLAEGEYPVVDKIIKSSSGSQKDGSITLNNATKYNVDINKLLKSPIDFKLNKGKPQVLIVHTHGTEGYLAQDNGKYSADEDFRTFEEKESVIAVGAVISAELEKQGIKVIHDKTIHDYPSFNGSYNNTLKTIQKNMANNKSISVVLDIHRDAIIAEDKTAYKTVTEKDGKKYAQVMFVMGTNEGGLTHDNWQDNLKFAFKVQEKLVALVEDIARPINLKKERYNEHATKNSLLIEMGTCANTLEEAKNSGLVVANAIAQVLQGK